MQNTNKYKGQSFPALLKIRLYYFSQYNTTLGKDTVLMCHKDPSSAAGPPIVLYYHADTDWTFSKAILSAKYFQRLMLNHWVLIAEPTDKAFQGAWFANTNEDKIVFKNSGPTINSLHKYVFMVPQKRHLCKLTGRTLLYSSQSKQKTLFYAPVQLKSTQTMGTQSWQPGVTTKTQKTTQDKLKNCNTKTWGVKQKQLKIR